MSATRSIERFPLVDRDCVYNPSETDGLSRSEAQLRIRACCTFVDKVSKVLELKLLSRCTAKVFFHRFFSRQSLLRHDGWLVATTCIFLAAKVEEDSRSLMVVIDTAHKVRTKQDDSLSEDPTRYGELREKVLLCERVVLHTLDFDVTVQHPHLPSLPMIKRLTGDDDKGKVMRLKITTWSLLNDSLHTSLSLQYSAIEMAVAAVVLATKVLQANPASAEEVRRPCSALAAMLKDSSGMKYFAPSESNSKARKLAEEMVRYDPDFSGTPMVITNQIIAQILDGYEDAEKKPIKPPLKRSRIT